MIHQVSDRGSQEGILLSNAEENQTSGNSHRLIRDLIAKIGKKAQEEELQLFGRKLKARKKSATSLSTISVTLENIKRRLEVMKAGDRRRDQVETERGTPAEEVLYFYHTDLSYYNVTQRPPMMRPGIQKIQAATSWQSHNAKSNDFY